MSDQKGFTIVELLIIIVVIAILAAISIVAYTGIQDRARNSAAADLAGQVAGKARAQHAITGEYPATVSDFGTHNNEDVEEGNLDGATVINGTSAPSSTDDNYQAFRNGTAVVYDGSATPRPQVIFRDGSDSVDDITV